MGHVRLNYPWVFLLSSTGGLRDGITRLARRLLEHQP
jgi:hypothetical protein